MTPLPDHPLRVDVSVEDYAVAFAYCIHLGDQAKALEFLRVPADAWRAAQAWPQRIAADLASGGRELAKAYSKVFAETQRRLREAAAAPAASAPPESAGTVAAPASAPVPPSGSAPADMSLSHLSNQAAARVPFQAASGAVAQTPVRPPPNAPVVVRTTVATSAIDLDATAEAQLGRAAQPALPFDPTKPSPYAIASPAGPKRVDLLKGGTLPADEQQPTGPALPFHGAGSKSPPAPPRPDPPPDLTLEQYAAFRARLARFGEDDAETWSSFGVTSQAAKDALRDRFLAEFKKDAGLQARFVELVRRGR